MNIAQRSGVGGGGSGKRKNEREQAKMALHDVHELQTKDELSMVQQSGRASKAKLSLDEA
jgi:hypothetical protein